MPKIKQGIMGGNSTVRGGLGDLVTFTWDLSKKQAQQERVLREREKGVEEMLAEKEAAYI